MWKRLEAIGAVTVAVLSFAALTAGPSLAGCSPSDLADALINTIGDGPSFLKNHTKCAPHFSDPAFWVISGGVTLASTSSSDVKSACQNIENLDTSAGDYQQKVKSLYDKLPLDIQDAINKLPGVGDVNSASADLAEVLSFLSCACALADESGVSQITQVAGDCLQDVMCWADKTLFDNACTEASSPKLVDCANAFEALHDGAFNGHNVHAGDIINGWNDATGTVKCSNGICYHITAVDGPVSEYCYCPAPMVIHQIVSGDGVRFTACQCPPHTHRPDIGHIDRNNPVLARTCLCDGTNELVNADGSCPPPCNCGCKNNQIVLAKDAKSCTCTCGCPDGQILAGDKCVTPCAGPNQILLANGECCSPAQVTSCGTCCPLGSRPDAATGSCVSAPMPPPVEKATSQSPKAP